MSSKPAKIFVVDDHPVFRLGLRRLLEAEGDLVVCGEADDSVGAAARIRDCAPDLVIVDVSLRQSIGIDLVRQLKLEDERRPVLVISMRDEHLYAERALRAGAAGYITKDVDPAILIGAIRKALRGDLAVSEKLAITMLRASQQGSPRPSSNLGNLSDREMEVFELVGRGMKTRAIAEALAISIKTVESHQSSIKRKMGIRGMSELRRVAAVWVTTGSSAASRP